MSDHRRITKGSVLSVDEKYMKYCFQIAEQAFRDTGKKPCVGAVLVYNDRIIGEGYHERFGGPHAEVNCINSVKEQDQHLIQEATIYVSLEPCNHHGKTPPCSDLLVRSKVKRVVVSCLDPNPITAGNGIKKLLGAGIEVKTNVLEDEGQLLIRKFNTIMTKKRPFIGMKWAVSLDGYSGKKDEQVWLSNKMTKFVAHKLGGLFESILVGPNTARLDLPQLNNRYFLGKDPQIVLFDPNGRLSRDHEWFKDKSIIAFSPVDNLPENVNQQTLEQFTIKKMLDRLYNIGISTVLVEGGPRMQKSFIKEALWDEAHILSTQVRMEEGISAPFVQGRLIKKQKVWDNTYQHILNET